MNVATDVRSDMLEPRTVISYVFLSHLQAFVRPENRADPKNVYHMKNVSEVQTYMGRLVSKLELELELAIVFTEVRHIM